MAEVKKYKSMPLKCWNKAKELMARFYKEYAEIKDKGGIRWSGGAGVWDSIPMGLGDDVRRLSNEPYGANCAFRPEFSLQCMEATEAKGWARDLCAYMRNYWGSMYLNRYVFGGEFPKPDFLFQKHICCCHAKWEQVASEYEGIPLFAVDISIGPTSAPGITEVEQYKIDYVANQIFDAMEGMEKVTGRKFDDEKLIHAIDNEIRSGILWSEICTMNQAIPAPLDEKSMFSLYVLGTVWRSWDETVKFYKELKDEVKWRVDNQIAAVPTERFRMISDAQPPWSLLKLWRYMEQFGVVVVGSLYSITLMFSWDILPDGTMVPPKYPEELGFEMKNREQAVYTLLEHQLKRRPVWTWWYDMNLKSEMMLNMMKQWHCNAALIELNRGCEASALGQMENRLALLEAGYPVMTYEGNMGDEREVDAPRIFERVETFMESLGLKMIEDKGVIAKTGK